MILTKKIKVHLVSVTIFILIFSFGWMSGKFILRPLLEASKSGAETALWLLSIIPYSGITGILLFRALWEIADAILEES